MNRNPLIAARRDVGMPDSCRWSARKSVCSKRISHNENLRRHNVSAMTMRRLGLLAAWVALLVQSGVALAAGAKAVPLRLSPPHRHQNLAIFLVHGGSTIKAEFLTLDQAIAQGKVVVHETGKVNSLAIENRSDRPVYIQSGDIVRGGKQDRSLADDYLIAARTNVPSVAAYCVDYGRWSGRDGDRADVFASSTDRVVGRRMKLAVAARNPEQSQAMLWSEAEENLKKLSQTLGTDVKVENDDSLSMQRTLEHARVRSAVEAYVAKLEKITEVEADVIGYAAVINGQVSCADVYGSKQLFKAMWPRLLRSVAAEAAAERTNSASAFASDGRVLAVMRDAEKAKQAARRDYGKLSVTIFESKDNVLIETREERVAPGGFLHRTYLPKGVEPSSDASRR
jgi:hypothetical protein